VSPISSFVFEATRACNLSCAHCYNIWKGPGAVGPLDPKPLSTAQTLDMLEQFFQQSGATLCTLSGGEPLLRADLPEIVKFIADRGSYANLVTNGTLLDEAMLDRLGSGSIAIYELPLLCAHRGIHDAMSGLEGAFDRVTNAIAELKLRGETVVGVFVATRTNLPHFEETLELGVALGLDGLMFNRFNPGGEGRAHLDLQASPAELQAALDLAEEGAQRYDFPISCSIALPPCLIDTARYQRLTFGFCAAGTDRAYYTLDAVGHVRPCNHSATVLGNLRQQSFEELSSSASMREFVAARPRACSGCHVEHECLGGCKAAAEVCCGSPWEMDPFLAAFRSAVPGSVPPR